MQEKTLFSRLCYCYSVLNLLPSPAKLPRDVKITAYFCVLCGPVLFLHYNRWGMSSDIAFMTYEFVMEMKDTQSQPAKKAVKKRAAADKATTKRKVTVIALNILAMIAVVAALPYFTLLWVDSYTNHGETYAVPDICGIHLKKAVNVLAAQKLDYTIIERRYQENASADEVVVQYPAPGTRVKEGRKIALVINSAEKPKRSIPSVIDNRTYREAESHILAAGFVIEAVDTIPGEKDWVYELKYNGKRLSNGETVPQGSSLRVVIGSGNVKDDNKPVFDSNFDI